MQPIIEAVQAGFALALSFNPVFGLLGAAAAAAVLSVGSGARRRFAGVSLLIGFWLVGDGLRVIARARDLADGVGILPVGWLGWVTLAIWAVGGFAVGYALPAWAGTFAGKRVILGTGWLTGVVVSVTISFAIAGILGGVF